MFRTKEKYCSLINGAFIILIGLNVIASSKLEFYGGRYQNLLIAIDPTFSGTNCEVLITEIKNTITQLSIKLSIALDGRASFGNVKILIPQNWRPSVCNLSLVSATAAESYSVADLKITNNHIIARSVPWTRQYRGCGQSAEDIIIPSGFLLSPDTNSSLKANTLLHEWAKFRYGAFEEHSYFEDETYPACYSANGKLQFSSCSDVVLNAVSDDVSSTCRTVVSEKTEALLSQLNSASSSLMFLPHANNIEKFCTNTTHNKWAATKHNVLCERKSVFDIIMNHPDFTSTLRTEDASKQQFPTFEIIQHPSLEYQPGYAFIIEDSTAIREQSRLTLVKQSIAQMLNLMDSKARIALYTFSGAVGNGNPFSTLAADDGKINFMDRIPNNDSPAFSSKLSPEMAKRAQNPNNLYFALNTTIAELNKLTSHDWEIFLIVNSPSIAFDEARTVVHSSSHAVTVVTYDTDAAWLRFYSTPNTKNVIVMPQCSLNGPECPTEGSSFFMDAFLDSARSKNVPRFFQKLAEAEVRKAGDTTFVINADVPSVTTANFHIIIMPIFIDMAGVIQFTSPSNIDCPTIKVLNHTFALRMDSSRTGCGYQQGTWRVDLSGVPDSSSLFRVQVIVESTPAMVDTGRLLIRSSIGSLRRDGLINPNSQLTPIFTRLTDVNYRPIISADVDVTLYGAQSSADVSQIKLLDDGIDPDILQNDGVYSAYILSYSTQPSFHNAKLSVRSTAAKTKAIASLSPENKYSAALLNANFSSKCCGSKIPVGTTLGVGTARYSSLFSGLRTSEAFNVSSLPPSKIGNIQVANDDGTILTLSFMAPGSSLSSGTIDHYDACCTFTDPNTNLEESSCLPITSPSDCVPVPGGSLQTCRISRGAMQRDFLGNIQPCTTQQNITVTLLCGVRGVNLNSISGKESNNLVEFTVTILPIVPEPEAAKCESLSDDCLPIVIFWGLIGCICGLVLIILALLVCYCISSKNRKSKSPNSRQEVLMGRNNANAYNSHSRSETPHLPDKDSPLYNVYVNKAYIQETDGQMKLVAADGELLPLESDGQGILPPSKIPNPSRTRPTISGPIPSVRRRSISVTEMNRETEDDGLPHTWGNGSSPNTGDMKIYKSHLSNKSKPVPPPKPYQDDRSSTQTLQKPSSNFTNNITIPIPKNRPSRKRSTYANPNSDWNTMQDQVPIPTISGSVGNAQETPIYASVNRNGRRFNQPIQPLANLIAAKSNLRRKNGKDYAEGGGDGMVPNRFSRPSSGYQSENNPSLPGSRPPSRFDAFPSSDSDTYSDMSRGISIVPKPPPVPPPFPNDPPTSRNTKKNIPLTRNSAERMNVQPKLLNRNPPNGNGSNPPPPFPPPKYVEPPAPPAKNNALSPYKTNEHLSDNEYDDDSEHWDDEDFDFNPGFSYA